MKTRNSTYRPGSRPKATRLSGRRLVGIQNRPTDLTHLQTDLEAGTLLTARQAAKHVGINVGTFNYHLRLGRIPYVPTPHGMKYVRLEDAQAFARQLEVVKRLHSTWDMVTAVEEHVHVDGFSGFDEPSTPSSQAS